MLTASTPGLVPVQEEAAPEQPPPEQPPPERERPTGAPAPGVHLPWRKVAYAAAAVVLLGAAVVVGRLLASDPSAPASDDGGGSTLGSSATTGTFSAKAPWRFIIRDHLGANDVGCNVTLTNTDSKEQREWEELYGPFRPYQIAVSGTFRYEVSDPNCLVLERPGAGRVKVPFSFKTGIGDTDAFKTTGPVEVKVLDFTGNSSCDPELHAVEGGRVLDFGEIVEGAGPLTLDPQDETLVYISTPDCGCAGVVGRLNGDLRAGEEAGRHGMRAQDEPWNGDTRRWASPVARCFRAQGRPLRWSSARPTLVCDSAAQSKHSYCNDGRPPPTRECSRGLFPHPDGPGSLAWMGHRPSNMPGVTALAS